MFKCETNSNHLEGNQGVNGSNPFFPTRDWQLVIHKYAVRPKEENP